MGLGSVPVGPVIPVSDLERSRAFYEDALGLAGEEAPGGYALRAGGEAHVFLLPAPGYAGVADWPLASFRVDDLDARVAELRDRGVEFLTDADVPYDVDDRGISAQEGMDIAWMRDPDGQVITVFQLT
jgi:catechol 2,3-dioxygenase-like lactoylglutathione lyase family enzyme